MPRATLVYIYKTFVRRYFDYGDVIYDNQYNAALAITGAIRGSSCEILYHKLGLKIFTIEFIL